MRRDACALCRTPVDVGVIFWLRVPCSGYSGGVVRHSAGSLRASMNETSASLLERLRRPADAEAWSRFVELYTPVLFAWARGVGLQDADAADLVQDVLAGLLRSLPTFQYDPGKSFRAWLRTVL